MRIEREPFLLIREKANHIRLHTNFTLRRGCKMKLKNVSIRESPHPYILPVGELHCLRAGYIHCAWLCAYYHPGSGTK